MKKKTAPPASMPMISVNKLILMIVINFVTMLVLMYAMTFRFSEVIINLNQIYMALLMTAGMMIVETLLMKEMFARRMWSITLTSSILVLIFSFLAIRYQWGINDRQLLQAMIPHHSGAVLMCERAQLENPTVRALCQNIGRSQTEEIQAMQSLLINPNATTLPAATSFDVKQNALASLELNATRANANLIGVYQGILVCADCPGVETTLLLTADNPAEGYTGTYQMVRIFQESPDAEPVTESGIFVKTQGTDLDPNAPVYNLRDSLGYPTWDFKELPNSDLEMLGAGGAEITDYIPKTLSLIQAGAAK